MVSAGRRNPPASGRCSPGRAAPFYLQTSSEAPTPPGPDRSPPQNKPPQANAASKLPHSKGHWAGIGGCTKAQGSAGLAAPGCWFQQAAKTDPPAAGAPQRLSGVRPTIGQTAGAMNGLRTSNPRSARAPFGRPLGFGVRIKPDRLDWRIRCLRLSCNRLTNPR